MRFLTPEQVLFIHARLIAETGGSHGVRDLNMMLSAVGRPCASFDGQDLYPDVFAKAAALMESLIRNRCFVDGNKRTGITAAGSFLRMNGYRLMTTHAEMVKLTMQVARSEASFEQIAHWLQESSRPA